MSISTDYEAIDIDESCELLAPVLILLERDATLCSIEIFARFQTAIDNEVKEIRNSFYP